MLKDGYTLMHEHLYLDLSSVKNNDDCNYNNVQQVINELKELYRYGVRNIIEVTNIGMGRNLEVIQQVAKETDMNILISTGCYKEPFIPDAILKTSTEELAKIMIQEIEEGIEHTGVKAQVIGEIGTSLNEWSQQERKLFDAAIMAHKKTGKLITTHTTLGTLGLKQAQYLIQQGVDKHKIVIGHMDLSGDIDTIKEIIKTGVCVGFDTIGKNNYLPDEQRVAMLMELERCNMLDHVVVSLDITRKSNLKDAGGIGYAYLFEVFIPMLKKAGFKEESLEKILKENPKRLFNA